MLLAKENRNHVLNGIARAFDFSWPRAVRATLPPSVVHLGTSDALRTDRCLLAKEYEYVYPSPIRLEKLIKDRGVRIMLVTQSHGDVSPKMWSNLWSSHDDCPWCLTGENNEQAVSVCEVK